MLITIVVVFRSVLGPPGDLGTNISVGLEGLFTSNSAALTTSNTYIEIIPHYYFLMNTIATIIIIIIIIIIILIIMIITLKTNLNFILSQYKGSNKKERERHLPGYCQQTSADEGSNAG